MAEPTTILLIVLVSLGISGSSVAYRRPAYPEQGTELMFAFMVHRHGDRTPDKTNTLAALDMDTDEVQALIDQWGYGQLTNVGKRTAFKLGNFIRRRYDGIIAPKYNDSEIYIRSTDVTRTKMTALSAMAAVFRPVGERWRYDINWEPVPYTTTPVTDDYILSSHNSCQKLMGLLLEKQISSDPAFVSKYKNVLAKLAHIVGKEDIADTPFKVLMTFQDLSSLISLGYDIGKELSQLYPKLSNAFDASWAYIFDNEDMITLQAGALLNEFSVYAEKIINGDDTQKVRVHSAHDINVYAFEAATKVNRQGRPKYGSLYSLELRRVVATGQYVVLPVYLADPNEGVEKYLQVKGCGNVFCDYELFKNITSSHRVDENTLKKKCSIE